MCDTFVVSPERAAAGRMLFGKNSDREPGEAQAVELCPSRVEATTRCTYLDVPGAGHTRRVLLCRPYWMWGAEMGVNDAGVAIGNEAVFTRAPHAAVGLTGMDLVRLALERAGSARAAVGILAELLETHGQGGAAGQRASFRYHNSFLIADADEAWLLETAARAWVAKRVRGVRAISNGLTLHDDWELACDGLAARARDYGLAPGPGRLDFARVFSDPLITLAAAAAKRRGCSEGFFDRHAATLPHAMAALRQHGAPDRPKRALSSVRQTVCAHAGALPTRAHGQTVGSLVAELTADGPRVFVTGTSAACLSLFKRVDLDGPLPAFGSPAARFDASTLWWRHERLHRMALGDLASALAQIAPERDGFERAHLDAAPASAFAAAAVLEARWEVRLREAARPLSRYWRRLDGRSGLQGA